MAGGLTHAEMKFVASVSEASNKEIIVGGSSILTPESFLTSLNAI